MYKSKTYKLQNYLIDVYYHCINKKIMNDINVHNMQYNNEGLIEVQTQQPDLVKQFMGL